MTESKATRGEIFKKLSAVNVSSFVEEKMGLKYLSWANAWAITMNNYPNATYEFKEFPEYVQVAANQWTATGRTIDYRLTSAGCEVTAIVHIEGNDYQMSLYVMDYKNKPVLKPDYAQINKTQQRALVKALALAGLGLNLYQGEDLPTDENLNQKAMKQSKQLAQQKQKPVQQKQAPAQKEQISPQQILNQATKEFNELKRQLMKQQGLSERQITNIARQAGQNVTGTLNKMSAGNEALKQMLRGEVVNA